MGFLSNIFKKKPGGTLVGNLIRSVANQVTGGLLGNGASMISQKEYDKRELSDAEYQARYGETKNGVVLPTMQSIAEYNQQKLEEEKNQQNNIITTSAKLGAFELIKKNWIYIILPFGLFIFLIVKAFKK